MSNTSYTSSSAALCGFADAAAIYDVTTVEIDARNKKTWNFRVSDRC